MYYRMFASRGNDPKWISDTKTYRCCGCNRLIEPGERMYYFPYAKTVYCAGDSCGLAKERHVNATATAEQDLRARQRKSSAP